MAKILRKRLARLNARRIAQQHTRDTLSKTGSKKITPMTAYKLPGSMKK